jgi:predicted DCC family thiol-disulfide oxidoreductase YuxK
MTRMLDSDPTLAPATADADRGQAAFTRTGLALYDLLVLRGLCPCAYETNILLIDGVALIKAEGSIRLAVGLGLPWSPAGILRVLPRRLADVLYEWVARDRFRMFGRRKTCYLPRTVDRERFIA